MRPDDNHTNGRVGTPQPAARPFLHTPPARDPQYRQQQAAADLVRSQLDAIYNGAALADDQATPSPQPEPAPAQPAPEPEQPQPTAAAPAATDAYEVNPYDRTQQNSRRIQADQWRHYHSAWQDYYQKYYEQYYTQMAQAARQSTSVVTQAAQPKATEKQPTSPPPTKEARSGGVSKTQAMRELRESLLKKVEQSATKARRSRHFLPIASAAAVLLIVGFIQYNPVIVASAKSFISPGTTSMSPQDFTVDPMSDVEVGPEARLIIPKINVNTPVFYDIPTDEASQNKAMESGVAHFPIPGANSHPGEVGNTVLSGHSSNDVFAAGDYKFIFMQLDKIEVGDTIYANYNGKRYTYTVTKKEEVLPTEVGKLVYETDKPVMTLITCTPLGTALRRLLVTAEQVYPAPSQAAPAPTTTGGGSQATIPGQGEKTLFERLFGG